VNPRLLQRQVALAAVALVAALGSLALHRAVVGDRAARTDGVPPVRAKWYEAVVGTFGPGLYGRTTACGIKLTRATSGIAHPELPCGVKVVLANAGREVRTVVVDEGLVGARHDFDVTPALAEEIGISGVQLVRWRFAEKS
jgi:rare lipoprotein A